ncbi:MAG: Ig domain-containing protein, partial [Paludibacteraceae bacterium]|nr:Ig domain-containing protein [Paludibacteraceae bacterium]
MAATGAVAQTETLLTTITATGKEQANYSTEGVATVSFSYTAYGSSAYLANWGWWGYGWSATVNAAEGYTITKCIFYDDANRTATDIEAPFVVETTEEDKTPRINGTPIDGGIYRSKGIKKIEVYGYENPTTVNVTGITLSQTEAAMTVGGETLTLTATVAPDDATDKTVTWTSSDPTVATVANGVVTAVAAGTATITATATNGTDDTTDD